MSRSLLTRILLSKCKKVRFMACVNLPDVFEFQGYSNQWTYNPLIFLVYLYATAGMIYWKGRTESESSFVSARINTDVFLSISSIDCQIGPEKIVDITFFFNFICFSKVYNRNTTCNSIRRRSLIWISLKLETYTAIEKK